MNLNTVVNNLNNTIAGKEAHIKTLSDDLLCGDFVSRAATIATIEFLKINIEELKRIKADIELCI